MNLFIYMIVGIVFVGACFLAVYMSVSECARDVCVCVRVRASLLSMSGWSSMNINRRSGGSFTHF